MSPALATMPTPILVADRADRVTSLERDWRKLYQGTAEPNPFLSWEWQRSWLDAHPRSSPLVVVAASPQGGAAGLLALQRRHRSGLRVLEFLGQQSGGDELDCLLAADAPAATAERLLEAALRHAPWDLLRCEGAAGASALGAVLAQAPGIRGTRREPGEWLPSLRLPGSFEEFLRGQSANFRAQVRRRRRALQQLEPRAWLECLTAASEIAGGLPHLYRLHQLRRQQAGDAGVFHEHAFRRFLSLASSRLAAAGACRLYLLRTPSAVIAALHGMESQGRFLYFQSGFDPAWTGWSPGTVLLSQVMEDCIARGLQQFEFLRGEEQYKARWTSERRRTTTLLAAGSALGQLYLHLRERRKRWRGEVAA